jgi:hypothetical protein
MEQPSMKPKYLFNLSRDISTGSCRRGKFKLTLPTAIFIAVGNSIYFFFKRKEKTCFFKKSCIVPHSSLKFRKTHSSLKFRKTRINYSLVN